MDCTKARGHQSQSAVTFASGIRHAEFPAHERGCGKWFHAYVLYVCMYGAVGKKETGKLKRKKKLTLILLHFHSC